MRGGGPTAPIWDALTLALSQREREGGDVSVR